MKTKPFLANTNAKGGLAITRLR